MIQGHVKTKVFATKQEAKKWEAAQEAHMWEAEHCPTPTACLHDFANAYLDMATERFAHKTVSEKKLAFKSLYKTIPPTTQSDAITPAMVLQALRRIARDSSGYAANKARKNLVAAWEWGRKYCNLPTLNPFREVDKFPADANPRYVPPEEDFWKAYEAASPPDKIFLLVMLHTAARRAEVFRMRWDDVDIAGRKIRFGTRKTAHGGMEYAWVPMTTDVHEALVRHKKQSRSLYVFTDPETGQPYKARQHYMERLCRRAKVKAFGFHAIRHLSATLQAYGGMDIPEVQAVLRHKNPNTTARYIKSLGVQTDKLDCVFSKTKTPKVLPFGVSKKAIGT